MAYLDKSDRVLEEGWWKKRGGKGHLDHTTKNRYFVLTDRYLDWYIKPGDKRKGCILLDAMYVRQESDALVIGNSLQHGKEFRLHTEGADANGRITKWYKAITKAIDDFKDAKRGGTNQKQIVNKGGEHDRPDKPTAPKTEIVVTTENHTSRGPHGVTSVTTTTVPSGPGMAHQHYSAPAVVHVSSPTSNVVHHHIAPPVVAPTTTVHHVSPYAPVPIHTMGPVVTTHTMSAPVPVMSAPMMTVHMQPAPMMIACAYCRQIFQSPGSQAFACPYCKQINQAPMVPGFM